MDEKRRGTDIHALFGRLGLSATGYREFLAPPPAPTEEPAARVSAPVEPIVLSRPPAAAQAGDLRWSGLEALAAPAVPTRGETRPAAPRVALHSRAGGVGRSTLAAGLARLLAARGLHVVLGDGCITRASEHLLQASAPRFGRLAFLHVPLPEAVPISVLDLAGGESAQPGIADPALFALEQAADTADAVLVDLPSAPGIAAESLLRSADVVLVPLLPDVASTASVGEILRALATSGPHAPEVRFVMNRYVDSLPFHRRVRTQVERLAGHRLLESFVREEPLISEALADRLTVIDYAPSAPVVGDFERLATWVAGLGAQPVPDISRKVAGAVA